MSTGQLGLGLASRSPTDSAVFLDNGTHQTQSHPARFLPVNLIPSAAASLQAQCHHQPQPPAHLLMALDRLPADLLALVAENLSATDLVKLGMASKGLAKALAPCDVWQQESKQRWPLCSLVGPDAALHQQRLYGSYQELFSKRMAMRSSFPDKCDLLRTVTAAARHKTAPSSCAPASSPPPPAVALRSRQSLEHLFRQALQLFSSLHTIIAKRPSLKLSLEYRELVQDIAWWLNEHPQVLVHQAREAIGDGLPCPQLGSLLAVCPPGQVHQSIVNRLTLISVGGRR